MFSPLKAKSFILWCFLQGLIHLVRTQTLPKNQYFLPSDTHTYMYIPRGKNVSSWENFPYVLNEWTHPLPLLISSFISFKKDKNKLFLISYYNVALCKALCPGLCFYHYHMFIFLLLDVSLTLMKCMLKFSNFNLIEDDTIHMYLVCINRTFFNVKALKAVVKLQNGLYRIF